MTIASSTVLVDGTVAITAGTSTVLETSEVIGGSHNVFLDDGSDLIDLTTATFTVTKHKPQASAPGGYTQARRKVKVRIPRTLANGNRTVDTFDIAMSTDPETTDAERLTMRVLACGILTDSDFLKFWDDGSAA